MQIQHLKHLMALAEHRTLSLSARALGISQAALSKSVRRLEAYLDVRLFERTPHGMVQTEYGRALIEQARSVLTQVAETERIIRTLRNGGAGRIAIGATVSVIECVAAQTIAWLLKRQEAPDIHIIEGMHDQLFDYLRQGDIDVVLANMVQDETAADLEQDLLYYDDVVVVVRPGHPLTHLPRVEPPDIAKYRWVMTGVTNVARRRLERKLEEHGLPKPNVAVESASLSFEREILMQTDLLGYMSTIALQPSHSCSTLVPLNADWIRWQRPVGIITRAGTSLSPACRKFLAQLKRQASVQAKPDARP
jgi:DNA-binding transcriptional LysR family regulator